MQFFLEYKDQQLPNIFESGELEKKSVSSILEHTAKSLKEKELFLIEMLKKRHIRSMMNLIRYKRLNQILTGKLKRL